MKKAATIVLVIGFIYAVLPDPLPGPIDDILVNLVTMSVSFILRSLGDGVTKGVDGFMGKLRSGVSHKVDARVASGKMSAERAASVKQAAANVHAETVNKVESTVNVVCDEGTRKITGFK